MEGLLGIANTVPLLDEYVQQVFNTQSSPKTGEQLLVASSTTDNPERPVLPDEAAYVLVCTCSRLYYAILLIIFASISGDLTTPNGMAWHLSFCPLNACGTDRTSYSEGSSEDDPVHHHQPEQRQQHRHQRRQQFPRGTGGTSNHDDNQRVTDDPTRQRRPIAHNATSQSISLPQACQSGRFRRANNSRYGPGEQRSITAYCSSGLWLWSWSGA